MASGDIFSNMHTSATTGGTTIAPAAGVNIMITFIAADAAGSILFCWNNSTGSFDVEDNNVFLGQDKGYGNDCKIFITSIDSIGFKATVGTQYFAYTGIEL